MMRWSGGHPYPLGANFDGEGVNFALFSAHAERVELCIYDALGERCIARYELTEQTDLVWHGYLHGAPAHTVYGYRVYGPYQPELGHRFNGHKLLLDPYAKQLVGQFRWHPSHYGYQISEQSTGERTVAEHLLSTLDNADFMPKARVWSPLVKAECAAIRPMHPWRDTVIYELHVKGFSQLHPGLAAEHRGRFSALGQPSLINYLKALGVTSVELLPVHSFIDEAFLANKGLVNYWGYNTLNFFTPQHSYGHIDGLGELRSAIAQLHDAGLEVLLDVVYNHTAEGNHLGPTLSFRGIDNLSYYRLQSTDKRYYTNDTGCGNTLNANHPRVLQLIMDSLRHWVEYYGVDGFRFDLATILGRLPAGFDSNASFFAALRQDPILNRVKLIAEPWDIGPGGYQLGGFPTGWAEWNDRYRDTVRRYWRGDIGQLPELARRIHGSSDLFEHSKRSPFASVNFITSHDGFSLLDLVSYEQRHNEANLENNQDGHGENFSANYGEEGPSPYPPIVQVRQRQQRNMLMTLVFSQGVPMLQAGDEMQHSRLGNNNAYCQDNELNWLRWPTAEPLTAFVAGILALRRQHPLFRQPRYIHHAEHDSLPTILWLNQHGQVMQKPQWGEHHNLVLGLLLSGVEQPPCKTHLLLLFNAAMQHQWFQLPTLSGVDGWQVLVDTAQTEPFVSQQLGGDSHYKLVTRSCVLLRAFTKENGHEPA